MRFFKLKMLFWSLAQLTLDKTWHCFNLSLGEKFNQKNRITGEYQTMPQSPSQLCCWSWCWCWCCCCCWWLCWCSGRWLGAEAENCFSGISKQAGSTTNRFLFSQPDSTCCCTLSALPRKSDRVRSGDLESDGMPWDYIRWHQIRWELPDSIYPKA